MRGINQINGSSHLFCRAHSSNNQRVKRKEKKIKVNTTEYNKKNTFCYLQKNHSQFPFVSYAFGYHSRKPFSWKCPFPWTKPNHRFDEWISNKEWNKILCHSLLHLFCAIESSHSMNNQQYSKILQYRKFVQEKYHRFWELRKSRSNAIVCLNRKFCRKIK